MHVFITGGTGMVGRAVVQHLLAARHSVSALARSDSSAKALEAAGAKVLRGDLEDVATLKAGAGASDGTIHCGFIHDFSNYAKVCAIDQHAIEAMGSVLSGKPFIVTSGIGVAMDGSGTLITEASPVLPDTLFSQRQSEQAAFALLEPAGVRAMVMRLPPVVHGPGDHQFIPQLIKIAREKGEAGYVGGGTSRWPAVHNDDAARTYVAALEKGKAGQVYMPIGDEEVPVKEIVEVIGRKLGVPVVRKEKGEEASQHFGMLGSLLGMDGPASGKVTQEELGVQIKEMGLLEDLETGDYFDA
ncbi:hypothetical protein RQP46_000905 [Phenoliferia psychrophenolica]